MFRLVPPAGTRVSFAELKRIRRRISASGNLAELLSLVREMTGKRYCFALNSGRAASTLILQAVAAEHDPDRNEVIVPGYTCYSVPASVVRAGLKVRAVDVDPATMDFDYSKLESVDFSRVAAIVAANLFGIPSDLTRLEQLAQSQGVELIDDAAQTLGTWHGGRACGTAGIAGFYSLDRGKNLSAWAGGLLVTDSDQIADFVQEHLMRLHSPGPVQQRIVLAKYILSCVLLHPGRYWIPASLPFLGLGQTVFDPAFPIELIGPVETAAAVTLWERLEQLNHDRSKIGNELAHGIRDLSVFSIPGRATSREEIAYLRLPVLADSIERRDQAILHLKKNGIKASSMYPGIVAEIDDLRDHLVEDSATFEGSRLVADQLFTLPTHGFVEKADIDRIISTLSRVAQSDS